jgi:uncharacterized protein (TIGR03435 family)
VLLIAVATSVAAQSPASTTPVAPVFAIASIKPSVPSPDGRMFVDSGARPGGQWFSQNTEFISILRSAYPAFSLPGQIVGGPDWVSTARFDINARAEGNPPRDVMTEMLKRLLSDRFSLKVHTEQREVDVYALVLARPDGRLGPGIKASTADCQAVEEARKKAAASGAPPTPAPKLGAKPECGMQSVSMNCVQRLATGGMPIGAVTIPIQQTVGRPVVDRTGLTGRWDIELQFACTTGPLVAADRPDAPASVFTALQEQLGLKLESRKEKMDVLVIDQVEMPTPN